MRSKLPLLIGIFCWSAAFAADSVYDPAEAAEPSLSCYDASVVYSLEEDD